MHMYTYMYMYIHEVPLNHDLDHLMQVKLQ